MIEDGPPSFMPVLRLAASWVASRATLSHWRFRLALASLGSTLFINATGSFIIRVDRVLRRLHPLLNL